MTVFPQIRGPEAVVFDLEFTAWEGSWQGRWLKPGEFKEVVQIGAVKIDAATLEETGALDLIVRPRINPLLSAYLVALTGIGNDRVKAVGVDFADAYARFVAFAGTSPIVAFGRDDLVLSENLRLYGIADAPALPRYFNVTPWLRANGVEPKGYHACDIARLCGGVFNGKEHDALDDARSVAMGIKALVARGAPNFLIDTPPPR
jgi:inhibitor of KinA sporulation pathway (predicted exonuclease)